MHRFFVSEDSIQGDKATLEPRVAHQLREVLRARQGTRILLLDNTGWEYEVELSWVGREGGEGVVKGRRPALGEPRTIINLYQSLLKGDKFELVLQKGTELGISAFYPVFSLRSVVTDVRPNKQGRWGRVLSEAAEQSGRGRLPLLAEPVLFADACEGLEGLSLLPYEEEKAVGLKEVLRRGDRPSPINLFIGPEGRFEAEEVEFARSRGIIPVCLGPRILRAETAGLVAATAILYELGELGPQE
ncbi:MAG: RsmE family RNA methyltransferase [Chloroflexota bacterium]